MSKSVSFDGRSNGDPQPAPGHRRHSISSSIPNEDIINAFPGLQRSTSCISVVSTAVQTSKNHGGLSVLAAAEVVQGRNLHPILEGSESPTKKYFSLRTNPFKESPFAAFGSNRPTTRGARFLDSIKEKFGLGPQKSAYPHNKTFEKICFELARVDATEVGSEAAQVFEMDEMELRIGTIDKKYTLVLPPAMNVPGLGDLEEQGIGGTCDQFIGLLPMSCKKISEKASPLGLVPKLLPYGIIGKEARYVGSCFWIWLCIVDDLTENLVGKAWSDTEADLFLAFSKNTDESLFNNKDDEAVRVSLALRNVIHSTNICTCIVDSQKEAPWREAFMTAVCEILVGFREERPLLDGKKIAMFEWMRLRAITISVRPFLILARADLGLTPTVSTLGNPLDPAYQNIISANDDTKVSSLRKVECMLQLIMGLQNDILGWEKDFKTNNPLSAIQVLIQHGAKHAAAMSRVIGAHNELVRRCIQHAQLVCDNPADTIERYDFDGIGQATRRIKANVARPSVFSVFRQGSTGGDKSINRDNVRQYVQLILGFAHGMATWMAVSKRYTV